MVAIQKVTKSGTEYIPPIEPIQNGYKVTKSDIYSDSTGRSAETGVLLKYLIRANVVSIELQYEGTETEINSIESIFTGTTLNVTYRDGGTYVSKDMYPSDRAKSIESLRGNGRFSFAVTLVEI